MVIFSTLSVISRILDLWPSPVNAPMTDISGTRLLFEPAGSPGKELFWDFCSACEVKEEGEDVELAAAAASVAAALPDSGPCDVFWAAEAFGPHETTEKVKISINDIADNIMAIFLYGISLPDIL
jgi:hypothetical protein